MMKTLKISTKIRILGALLTLTIFTVILTTLYLNHKNEKDALIVNIAGKERMLTQRMTKNIFHLYQIKTHNFIELDKAVNAFKFGMDTLKDGNVLLGIEKSPTQEISAQISKVLLLWNTFEENIKNFKHALLRNDPQMMDSTYMYISKSNNELLKNVDHIVTLYTMHIEQKTDFIKKFQYLAFALLFILTLYSIIQLKQIEAHAREFLEQSKKMASAEEFNILPQTYKHTEGEIVEVTDNLNCFITKVNDAMNYSQTALEQSQKASTKLEELTSEFDDIIHDMEDQTAVIGQLDKSEDIMLESSEELLRSTKKLQKFKEELDKLLITCKA
ncbi:MAG: type IV pili methyl-accepting chemotaxis transducer N-terminal domain-containing protein [Campylobacterota bacterium]|nr:type IV pili methyl-accepting chemotaxis transducer N-terminal domain-containing protein [Campylobacterota bacterium]